MPILRLIAEWVGPFERLDLDLSDGKGNPHLGPHILAGVNGSGKSTVLKTIAWVLAREGCGFDVEEWRHYLKDRATPSAKLTFETPEGTVETVRQFRLGPIGDASPSIAVDVRSAGPPLTSFCPVAAYAPTRGLKYLANPDITRSLPDTFAGSLGFAETVQNELVQAWLVGLRSKRALAREMNQPAEEYSQALARFESALRLIYEDRLRLVVELKPGLHPCIQMGKQRLNLSQLPDGVRSTIGWLADFMMRQDLMQWDPRLKGKRPGVLLLDEVDAHLHPQWQRTLLPTMREALPDVQIIVTTHSPFVINSCPGSRVHVLDVDAEGHASLKTSIDAPVGQSLTTTLKGIFGVESRFDIQTERELDEWYQLSRKAAGGSLSPAERRRMAALAGALADRSEELRGIVSKPAGPPKSIESILRAIEPKAKSKSRQRKAG